MAGRDRSPGFRDGLHAFPGSLWRTQWLSRDVRLARCPFTRSQWRDRAGFAPDFP
jgi:hypothetical protein